MKPSQERDLVDLSTILETFATKLPIMAEADLIDLAARLKPVTKMADEIDKYVKAGIKEKLKGKEGMRLGNMFKACLKIVTVEQFQQKAFKEAKPALAAQFTETCTQERITYELR